MSQDHNKNTLLDDKNLYLLIDRLQKHSEWKYPNRVWTINFYNECAFMWKDKQDELLERIILFEEQMNK